MVLLHTPNCEVGTKAADFSLQSIDGRMYGLNEVKGENGLVVAFICNHCPYVQTVIDRIVKEVNALKEIGIGFISINSNDALKYPEDSYNKMIEFAKKHNFSFPYVYDETQAVAKTYGAVCTPDIFGFNKDLILQYRGRLDSGTMNQDDKNPTRELFVAMSEIAEIGEFTGKQVPSMGCSIKWKDS